MSLYSLSDGSVNLCDERPQRFVRKVSYEPGGELPLPVRHQEKRDQKTSAFAVRQLDRLLRGVWTVKRLDCKSPFLALANSPADGVDRDWTLSQVRNVYAEMLLERAA